MEGLLLSEEEELREQSEDLDLDTPGYLLLEKCKKVKICLRWSKIWLQGYSNTLLKVLIEQSLGSV